MNPTPTNLFSTSTSTQNRLPNNFSSFRNQISQSVQSCSDSDLESTRKDSQNSQDSTQFTQNLPSQVQMYYPNSYPSNKETKQDFGLFSDENPSPIGYHYSRKKIQSLNEIEVKDDLAVRMVNRQREILLNNRASTSTALQPIAEKAETPRNDGSDITESSSPQSTRQDLMYLQDNDLLKKYDESERESQGKLSNTTTPLSARSMFPTSFFGSSNPIVPLQNFNSSSCINLSSGFAKPDGSKPNLPPLSVPSTMHGTNKTGAASRDLFSEFNNEKSDEDTSPSRLKMMQNKFLPKRTVSDNNIPTLFNKKDEPAKSAQKILNPSANKVFDFGQNLRVNQCYSALLKPKNQYIDYNDDEDDDDDGGAGFIAKLKNNVLPIKSNPLPNPDPNAFRPTKAFTDFPQGSTFGSQVEHNTSFGSHFQAPKIFGNLGGGCTSALLGPKTATKLFESDDEEEEMKTTNITNFKSVPLNSRAATENILPRLGAKLPHVGSFAQNDLNNSQNASKVLDFDDEDDDTTDMPSKIAPGQCASALLKTKESKTLFSECGQEEQELKNKALKPLRSSFAIGRSNSENTIPSFGFNKPSLPHQNSKLVLDASTPVKVNESAQFNFSCENNPLLAQLKAEKITSTPHSADHQFSSDPSKNDFRTTQASQFGPNSLKMQRSATVVCLPPNGAFFQRTGSFRQDFYLSEPPSRFDADYEILDILGQGTFMKVLLCEHVLDKQLYVVKCSHQKFNALDDEDNITQTLNKVQAMTSGNTEDPNHHVVRYYNSWKEDGNLFVVMEYCEGGNLTQLNFGGADKSESEIRKILLDICTALKPLHQKKAVHLHIKPENILLSKAGKYKLGDFGLSNLDYQAKLGNLEGDTVDKDLENAMYYFGPELLDDEHCGVRTLDLTKADIYSFGLCLAEFILGANFREDKEIMDDLKEGDFSILTNLNYSDELKETIQSMLSDKPEQRPSAEYVLQQYMRNDAQEIQQEKQENKKLRATVDHLKKQLGLKRKKSL